MRQKKSLADFSSTNVRRRDQVRQFQTKELQAKMMTLIERNKCLQVLKLSRLESGGGNGQMMLELTRLHGIKHRTLQDCSNQQISHIARLMFVY